MYSENQKENSRWIRCPNCDKKTRTKVYADTVMLRFPLYCPKCGTETIILSLTVQEQIKASKALLHQAFDALFLLLEL